MKPRKLLVNFFSILALLVASGSAYAETNPELRITPAGEIHLIGVELWQKHAANLYTVRAWGMKWIIEIPYGLTLLSAHDAAIKPEEFTQGSLLEIKGKVFTKNTLDYSIDPSMIKNLSVQTGKPKSVPPTPPPAVPEPAKKPVVITPPAATEKQKGLYMLLKKGYRGGQVSLLQKFLKGQGLVKDDAISGYFGAETEKALKKFQEANNLETTGTLGPKTRALINSLAQ